MKILKTIDLNKYTPKLINIEVSETNKEEIYKYLSLYGYNIFDLKSVSYILRERIKKKGSKNCPFFEFLFENNGDYIPMPPIPPMPPMPPIPPGIPAGAASFSSGLSAIIASVVTNNPEIDAAS